MTTADGADLARWRTIDRLFAAALERAPAERAGLVAAVAGTDQDLADAVAALLRAEAESSGRFEAPALHVAEAFATELETDGRGPRTIGPYAVLRVLGRGGMGTVYLAERQGDGFRQRVALKVLRRGMDTDDLLRRFVAERHILASLAHPNIARLYDGGATAEGQPYLAMEYVEGEPITVHCDARKAPLRRRLELLLEVARAVSAAHASLVVHRDLKPSNILVTTDGDVKLLDFGIAKLLDAAAGGEHTQTGQFLLTPDHASPEQLRGEPVTTATDVYQLGVLCYRLVTGRAPYAATGRSPDGLRALADRLDVPRPSDVVAAGPDAGAIAAARGATPAQLRRGLAGDLDTVVATAMHPDPARRYRSAEALAGDVRRFLDGRPIAARPDTLGYRTRTFLRRRPWVAPVGAAAVVFVGLYVATLVRHTTALEAERNEATAQAARAQEVQRFLVDLFASADPYAPADPARGRGITVVEALDVGTARIASALADRPDVRAAILSSISQVYQNLGVHDRARPLREEALALQITLQGPASRDVRDSLGSLALIRGEQGDADAAGELHTRRLALAEAARPLDPAEVADARIRLGRHLMDRSQTEAAEAQFTRVLTDAADRTPAAVRAAATPALADVLRVRGDAAASERRAREAVALVDASLGADSVAGALARGTLAQTLGVVGRVEEADRLFTAAIDSLERTLGATHAHRLATMSNLSVLRLNTGNLEGAETLLREIVAIGEQVLGARHPSVAGYLQNHATVLVRLGRLDDARDRYERAAGVYRQALGRDNYARALPLLSLSGLHLTARRAAAAEAAAREALDILNTALPAGHAITAVADCRVARAQVALGRGGAAAEAFARAVPPLVTATTVPEYRRECLDAAAAFHQARGDRAEAARLRAALGGASG